MKGVFSYWLGEGIDGFVVQSAAFLYEDPKLEDGFVNEKASIKFIAEIRKLIGRFLPSFTLTEKKIELLDHPPLRYRAPQYHNTEKHTRGGGKGQEYG